MGIRTRIRKLLRPSTAEAGSPLFKLYKFEENGRFNYNAYRDAQVGKASNDKGDVWADPKTLDLIAHHARAKIDNCTLVLCHGCKSGMESSYLAEQLGCEGIGTDISPPKNAKRVIEWDFHEPNEDWHEKASVIYTNALDHSYDPKIALDTWVSQLAPGGRIYIEHTLLHGPTGASLTDPFGADPLIMPYLVLEWGQGVYCVHEIIKAPHKKPHWKTTDGKRQDTDLDIWIFVIKRL